MSVSGSVSKCLVEFAYAYAFVRSTLQPAPQVVSTIYLPWIQTYQVLIIHAHCYCKAARTTLQSEIDGNWCWRGFYLLRTLEKHNHTKNKEKVYLFICWNVRYTNVGAIKIGNAQAHSMAIPLSSPPHPHHSIAWHWHGISKSIFLIYVRPRSNSVVFNMYLQIPKRIVHQNCIRASSSI